MATNCVLPSCFSQNTSTSNTIIENTKNIKFLTNINQQI